MSPVSYPDSNESRVIDPNKLPVTKRRAAFLARESGLDVRELTGKSVGEVNELIRWHVDPQFLLVRRICGQVVKRDPVTGELCPVPGATVHIEDTDCTFLGFFPVEPPFFWMLPINCNREQLATIVTDSCGRFCVNLPYWDVDRILSFRRHRICLPEIYRPRLRDIIDPLPEPPDFRDPRPQPDPLPIDHIDPEVIEQVRHQFGEAIADGLISAASDPAAGGIISELDDLFDVPLPPSPPPLPRRFQGESGEAVGELAEAVGLDQNIIGHFHASHFLGPFTRCRDVWTAEWVPFFDVPDITFRVTQDVDGDSIEEQIYGESFFDVRWNSASGLDVILEAGPNAICVPFCDGVDGIPCEDEPAISTAGTMPLEPTHHNNTSGYATRVNRPSSTGSPGDVPGPGFTLAENAVTPYAKTLNLFGCHRIEDATHYRLWYSRDGDPAVPFTEISWWAPALAGPPVHILPDVDGWYPILPPVNLAHPNWLLHWNTRTSKFFQGTYDVRVEVGTSGTGGISSLTTSDPVKFVVDNKKPDLVYHEVSWSYGLSGPWIQLPTVCPVIERNPATVYVRVVWSATAPHLRNAVISLKGCGGGHTVLVDPFGSPSIEDYREWYQSPSFTTVARTNHFEIPADALRGCYTLKLEARSRGFEPRGTQGPALNWFMLQGDLYSESRRAISLADK